MLCARKPLFKNGFKIFALSFQRQQNKLTSYTCIRLKCLCFFERIVINGGRLSRQPPGIYTLLLKAPNPIGQDPSRAPFFPLASLTLRKYSFKSYPIETPSLFIP